MTEIGPYILMGIVIGGVALLMCLHIQRTQEQLKKLRTKGNINLRYSDAPGVNTYNKFANDAMNSLL